MRRGLITCVQRNGMNVRVCNECFRAPVDEADGFCSDVCRQRFDSHYYGAVLDG